MTTASDGSSPTPTGDSSSTMFPKKGQSVRIVVQDIWSRRELNALKLEHTSDGSVETVVLTTVDAETLDPVVLKMECFPNE